MTAPNQADPAWMALLGLGAFTLGGAGGGTGQGSFGQGVASNDITQLIAGPAPSLMNLSGISAQSDLLTMFSDYLSTLPLQALQMFQPFLPGKTAADFVDVPTAVTTIMNALGLGALSATSKAIANLMQDLMVLLDVFHITYQAGTSTDPPGTLGTNGKPTWFSCWNDILSMVGLWTNTSTPTTPAPTIGTAITDAKTWSTRLTNDLLILLDVFHITYTSTQWNNAWTDLLGLFGIVNSVTAPTNPAPTIGTAITTGNNNTGLFLQYVRIVADVFHFTYPVGSPSDTPTTTSGGLPTWYSAWNGLLILEGFVKSTTAPTDTAPTTGAVIQANTAAATTAGTNASIAIASNQATNDAIVSATTGAPVTGSSTTDVTTGLSTIPATNIVGLTGAAVSFGALGAGGINFTLTSSKTDTWSHTIVSTDLGVLAILEYSTNGGTPTTSMSYGSQSMTLLSSSHSTMQSSTGQFAYIDVYWLKTPLSGTKTVTASISVSGGSCLGFAGNSYSANASKVGTVTTYFGSGSTSLSMTASSATGRIVIGAFSAVGATTPTVSAFNQTERYNVIGTTPAAGWAADFGDAAGASSVTFSATTGSTPNWTGVTVELEN